MKISEFVLSFLFPPMCGICGKVNKNWICNVCLKEIEKIIVCKKHMELRKEFHKHLYIFSYQDQIKELIVKYKFLDHSYLSKTFAKIISNNEKCCRFIKSYDIIIPVPIHRKRRLLRGYNQTELIIKELIKQNVNFSNIECLCNILQKVKNTKPQSGLKKEDRIKNLKNVYKLQDIGRIRNKKVLLFDDVYTTGNTANECSKILKQNGARHIGILTIAKD